MVENLPGHLKFKFLITESLVKICFLIAFWVHYISGLSSPFFQVYISTPFQARAHTNVCASGGRRRWSGCISHSPGLAWVPYLFLVSLCHSYCRCLLFVTIYVSLYFHVCLPCVLSAQLNRELLEDIDYTFISFSHHSVQGGAQKRCSAKAPQIRWSGRWYQQDGYEVRGKWPEGHLWDPVVVCVDPRFSILEPLPDSVSVCQVISSAPKAGHQCREQSLKHACIISCKLLFSSLLPFPLQIANPNDGNFSVKISVGFTRDYFGDITS